MQAAASSSRAAARAGPGPSSLTQGALRLSLLPLSLPLLRVLPPSATRCASSRSAPLGGGDLTSSPQGTPPPSPSAAGGFAPSSYDRILAFCDAAPSPAPVFEVAAALAGARPGSAAAAALLSSRSESLAPPTYHFSYDEEAEEEGADCRPFSPDPQMAGAAAHATALEPFSQQQQQQPAFAAAASAAPATAAGDSAPAFAAPPPAAAAAGTMSTARAVRRRARRAERSRRAAAGMHAPKAASLGDLEAMAPWVSANDAARAAARAAERAARAAGAPHPAGAAAAALAAIAGPAPRQALARRLEGVLERLTRAQAAGGLVYREPKRWVLTFDEESDAAFDGGCGWDSYYEGGVPPPPPGMRYAMATASFDEGAAAGMGDSY